HPWEIPASASSHPPSSAGGRPGEIPATASSHPPSSAGGGRPREIPASGSSRPPSSARGGRPLESPASASSRPPSSAGGGASADRFSAFPLRKEVQRTAFLASASSRPPSSAEGGASADHISGRPREIPASASSRPHSSAGGRGAASATQSDTDALRALGAAAAAAAVADAAASDAAAVVDEELARTRRAASKHGEVKQFQQAYERLTQALKLSLKYLEGLPAGSELRRRAVQALSDAETLRSQLEAAKTQQPDLGSHSLRQRQHRSRSRHQSRGRAERAGSREAASHSRYRHDQGGSSTGHGASLRPETGRLEEWRSRSRLAVHSERGRSRSPHRTYGDVRLRPRQALDRHA
ncbi:unnamed protein product, partial [Polarella glacialis]